ncbi:MAG: hypothetical protein ACUVX8_08510 [Candidatus Zipacnadales bacterium]
MINENREGVFSRRVYARLLIWGAAGLSLLPGCLRGERGRGLLTTCYAPPPPKGGEAAEGSLIQKYAHLGRIWREMTSHLKNSSDSSNEQSQAFTDLKREMTEALDAINAWPELRIVFEERWAHIHLLKYSAITCYAPLPPGTPQPRGKVEKQVEELTKLVAEGALTKEAAAKAAQSLAYEAEYYVQAQKTSSEPEALSKLRDQYNAGTLNVGKPAILAGQRLTEFTINDIGYLAGPPEEPIKTDTTAEEAEANAEENPRDGA